MSHSDTRFHCKTGVLFFIEAFFAVQVLKFKAAFYKIKEIKLWSILCKPHYTTCKTAMC